jgi:hypothetical protein
VSTEGLRKEAAEPGEGPEQPGDADGRLSISLSELPRRSAIAWRDLERLDSKLGDRALDPVDRRLLKDIKHWRQARPRAELPDWMLDETASIAIEFREDPGRVEELARDPDHGGGVRDHSLDEARIALAMERQGKLRDVVRDPRPGCGDLIEDDGAGQEWDVVSFPEEYFNKADAEITLHGKLERQVKDERMVKVIVNTAYLSPARLLEVERIVGERRWGDSVIYGSSELPGQRVIG